MYSVESFIAHCNITRYKNSVDEQSVWCRGNSWLKFYSNIAITSYITKWKYNISARLQESCGLGENLKLRILYINIYLHLNTGITFICHFLKILSTNLFHSNHLMKARAYKFLPIDMFKILSFINKFSFHLQMFNYAYYN